MKKVVSIIGVGMISMAVAMAPAFAQTKTQDQAENSSTVQPKTEKKEQIGHPAAKDHNALTSKPAKDKDMKGNAAAPPMTGSKVEGSNPAKSGPEKDVKGNTTPAAASGKETGASTVAPKSGPDKDVKANTAVLPKKEMNGSAEPTRPVKDKDNQTNASGQAKQGMDVKAGANAGKSEVGSKDSKAAAPEKSGADVKKNEKSSRNNFEHKVRHANQKTGKVSKKLASNKTGHHKEKAGMERKAGI